MEFELYNGYLEKYNGNTKNITLPLEIDTIGDSAFAESDIESITIHKNVKTIENSAFLNCKNLKEVLFEDGLEIIGDRAFDGCSNIERIDLPNTLKVIGDDAFYNCIKLTDITLNDGLDTIGVDSFNNTNIKKLFIPKSVNLIRLLSGGLNSLRSIVVDENNRHYASYNSNILIEKNTSRIVLTCPVSMIPDNIFRITEMSFMNLKDLREIRIPANITEIGAQAFKGTGLIYVEIPSSVKTIEPEAFMDCNDLSAVAFYGRDLAMLKNVFKSCPNIKSVKIDKDLRKELKNQFGVKFSGIEIEEL